MIRELLKKWRNRHISACATRGHVIEATRILGDVPKARFACRECGLTWWGYREDALSLVDGLPQLTPRRIV